MKARETASIVDELTKLIRIRERAVELHRDDARLPQPLIFRLAKEERLAITVNGLDEEQWKSIEAGLDEGAGPELDAALELVDSVGGEQSIDVIRIKASQYEVTLIWDEDHLSKS